MHILKIVLRWLIFFAVIGLVALGCNMMPAVKIPDFARPSFTEGDVVIYSLSLAFVWVEILRWGIHKPFNCMKCMSFWFGLILAAIGQPDNWVLLPFVSLSLGAIFSAVKLRWL